MNGHSHHAQRHRRLVVAIVVNVAIVVMQIVVGITASSLGLLADAGHNIADVAALVVSLVALRVAIRPPTARRSFGSHRFTILAGQANAVLMLAVTPIIVIEAVGRLSDPPEVQGTEVVIAAAVAMVANLGAARSLHRHAHGDLNISSAVLHLLGDGLASAGVLIAGAVIASTQGYFWLDPIASMAISLLIAVQAFVLLRRANHVLLEGTPTDLDVDELVAVMRGFDGVENVHDLHIWSLSSEMRAMSAHMVLDGHPTLEEAQLVAETVKSEVQSRFAIDHATLELECEACDPEPLCAVDPGYESASVSVSAVSTARHERTITDEAAGSSGSR